MERTKRFLTGFFLLFAAATLNAEVFRTHKTIVLQMPETGNAECVSGINDAIAIFLPADTTFLQALEIEIKIPDLISHYMGAVAYSIYTDISPVPSHEEIDYSGKRQMIDTLPGRLSLSLVIPLEQEHTIKQSPYTTILPVVYDKTDRFAFFRFQLVMKGIPESFDKETLGVTVKPVYVDKGKLSLDMKYPLDEKHNPIEKPYSVFIDENPVVLDDNTLILDTGMHHLTIVSDFYRNETRVFTIEQAQNTSVSIQLRDIAPTLQLALPEGTTVFFNDNNIQNGKEPFIIEQGEHILRLIVGDYEITKTIQAVNGRSYTVNLSMEVDITETQ